MKILMVNNRLKVYGGEGTYMTSVGDYFSSLGHDVQYFGLEDPDNLHGNRFEIYAKKSKNPLRILKNRFNAKQFGRILDEFKPDIVHLNLVYFTLTPSILVEAKKRKIPVVQTIHDGKIVCPSYQLFITNKNKACSLCLNHKFNQCFKNKCVKNSPFLSYLATKEAKYNAKKGYYDLIDAFIFPSKFMMGLHKEYGIDPSKLVYLQNFSRIEKPKVINEKKEDYILFFGRIEKIKGADVLADVVKQNPNINFVIAGDGSLKSLFDNLPNCKNLGFLKGKELIEVIQKARASVFPSVWNENCPMGILESIALGTPVICSNIGGMPELVDENKTGFLVKPGDLHDLREKIVKVFGEGYKDMVQSCLESKATTGIGKYCDELMKIYKKVKGQAND